MNQNDTHNQENDIQQAAENSNVEGSTIDVHEEDTSWLDDLTDEEADSFDRAEDDADTRELMKDVDPGMMVSRNTDDEDDFGYGEDESAAHELLESTNFEEDTTDEFSEVLTEDSSSIEEVNGDEQILNDDDLNDELDSVATEEGLTLKDRAREIGEKLVDKLKENPRLTAFYAFFSLVLCIVFYSLFTIVQGFMAMNSDSASTEQAEHLIGLDMDQPIQTDGLQDGSPLSKSNDIQPTTAPAPAPNVIPEVSVNPPQVKAVEMPTIELTKPQSNSVSKPLQSQLLEQKIQVEVDRRLAEKHQALSSAPSVVPDTMMTDKNTETILKLGGRMQAYEQLMARLQQTLEMVQSEQTSLLRIVKKNDKAIEAQQQSLEELAKAMVNLRRNNPAEHNSSGYVSRRPSSPSERVREQPTYEVIAASPQSVIVRGRRTGKPVPIEVGDTLIGYGRVTAINGFGQILTVSGPVKTK